MYGELLRIGPIALYKYGTALAAAFLVGACFAMSEARRRRLDTTVIVELVVHLMVLGLISGRVGYILPDLGFYLTHPSEFFRVSAGGLSHVTAFVVAVGYTRFYAKRRGLRFWELLDILAPGLAAGLIIGSLGAVEWQPAKGAVHLGPIYWSPPVLLFFTIEYAGCWYIMASRRRLPEGRRFCQIVAVDALARMLSSLWAWILYEEFLPHALSTLVGAVFLVGALVFGQMLTFHHSGLLESAAAGEMTQARRPRKRRLPARQRAVLAATWLGFYLLLVGLLGRTPM